jgi:hypothetical protein
VAVARAGRIKRKEKVVVSTSGKGRKLRGFLLAAVFVLALAAPNAAAARPTVVTLTFDDDDRQALVSHGFTNYEFRDA